MGETIGVNVLKRAQNMQVSPQFDGYSGVRIFTGTDDNGDAIIIESGNTSGRVLEIKNPFGSQEMADNILAEINGYQYQPLSADAAHLNPAAEMGDGVTVNGVYSGIFTRATKFGRLMASDIAAPTDEEIEHEFAVETASDRQYTRFVQQTKAMFKVTNQAITAEVSARTEADAAINATLSVHATDIAARVTKTGKNGSSTFAWSLDTDGFFIHNGTITQAMKQNKSALFNFTTTGLKIQGEIRATSGTIGGFTIGSSSIYSNGMSSMSSTQTTGVHVGTDGIKLGQNFSVNTSGNVSANNMTLTGTLNVGGSTISANTLRQGANDGYNWNNGSYGSTGQTRAAYALSGAGGGINFSNMENNQYTAQNVRTKSLWTQAATCTGDFFQRGSFYLDSSGGSYRASWQSKSIVTGVNVTKEWNTRLQMYIVTDVSVSTGTIYYVGR
jgi:hypothetical protein